MSEDKVRMVISVTPHDYQVIAELAGRLKKPRGEVLAMAAGKLARQRVVKLPKIELRGGR